MTIEEFRELKLKQQIFEMVKVTPYKEKWGEKWQQKSAKYRRKLGETVQTYIQTSAWNKLELGKK